MIEFFACKGTIPQKSNVSSINSKGFELGATKASIFLLMYEFTGNSNQSNMVVILSLVTFTIWVINLVIPSLLGSVFLFKAKLLKEK